MGERRRAAAGAAGGREPLSVWPLRCRVCAESGQRAVACDFGLFLELVQHAAVSMVFDHVLSRMQALVVVHYACVFVCYCLSICFGISHYLQEGKNGKALVAAAPARAALVVVRFHWSRQY